MSATVFHAPFIRALPAHFTLHTVMSSDPAKAKERVPGARKYVSTLAEVLADDEVHVVCVCAPNATHFEYTKVRPVACLYRQH